jgi:hypothetical protein
LSALTSTHCKLSQFFLYYLTSSAPILRLLITRIPVTGTKLIYILVLEFGKIVKKGIEKQKMLAWQYNAVGVSDAITMGGEGRSAYSERTPLYPLSLTSC